MASGNPTVLQVVPQLPGSHDGVGDYALTLAKILRESYGRETIFATPTTDDSIGKEYEHIILHYVNYGYQKRGVPFRLLSILRKLRGNCRGRFLTIFHELYASGPPWKSAFWLRPFQIQIARSISHLSDECIVTSEVALAQLKRLTPSVRGSVQPVVSNFGEPSLSPDQIANRDPHRWVICGGTALVERSLRSFRAILNRIPDFLSPRELFILGGKDNPASRSIVVDLANVRSDYRPQIAAAEASQILSTCSFAWLDYFHRPNVQTSIILKSGAFAAACAHGVISVFPHRGSAISLHGDPLPGPFFVDPNFRELPAANDRTKVAADFYNWYQRHASSEHLARAIASGLGLIDR